MPNLAMRLIPIQCPNCSSQKMLNMSPGSRPIIVLLCIAESCRVVWRVDLREFRRVGEAVKVDIGSGELQLLMDKGADQKEISAAMSAGKSKNGG